MEDRIVELYQQKVPIKEIAEIVFGTSGSYRRVIRILENHPESGYVAHRVEKRNRKYRIDDSFFKAIDNEVKAYFFGMMAADGWIKVIRKNPEAITLELQSADIEVIQCFRDALGDPNVPIIIRPPTAYSGEKAKVAFFSAKLARDIQEKLGEKKTFNLGAISKYVPKQLRPHFVRGVLDGDGSWSFDRYRMVLSFRGTQAFLEDLQSIVPEPMMIYKGNQKWPTLSTRTHRSACRMYYWLYVDCNPTIFLERKFNKARSGLSLQGLKEKFRISVKAP